MPTIQYTETALADLGKLSPRIAAQIIRKIDRLQAGLHGDIKRLPTTIATTGSVREISESYST